jgi:chromosome segregation ATPase
MSAGSATGSVTEADVTEIDEVLRRLDGELDRLDSDMAAGEGETQQVVLEARKRAATGAITRRLLALRERLTVAKSIVRLSDEDRSALTTQLQEQINGLTSLGARIQGDTDEATLRADAQRIVTDYRVYVLTIPKARGVMVADIEVAASDRLTRIAERLANAIDQARRDTTEAQEDLASMRSKLAAVDTAVLPIPAELLALQPAGYAANHAVLEQARQSLRTGRSDLADAAILARRVIADLK